jgi:hypothetical protein
MRSRLAGGALRAEWPARTVPFEELSGLFVHARLARECPSDVRSRETFRLGDFEPDRVFDPVGILRNQRRVLGVIARVSEDRERIGDAVEIGRRAPLTFWDSLAPSGRGERP